MARFRPVWVFGASLLVMQITPTFAGARFGLAEFGQSIDRPQGVATDSSLSFDQAAIAQLGFGAGTPEWRAWLAATATRLNAVKPDARLTTRGTRETAIYAKASPSVVLVLTDKAIGSGSIIDLENRYVLTNAHVIDDGSRVAVIFKPSQEGADVSVSQAIAATIVRVDEIKDLALLQVEWIPPGHAALQFGTLDNLPVGADVHAIGHPTGESWTYTKGIVSQVRRGYRWETEMGIVHSATVIQTQTPINPGNSGGPLLNDSGLLVGVNSFKGNGEGLNFAVSADDVRAFLSAKSSVLSPETQRAIARADAGWVEGKVVEKWRQETPPATVASVSSQGRVGRIVVPDDKSQPLTISYDSQGTGRVDTVFVDQDRDGLIDYAFFDTDGDYSHPEVIAYYKNGEAQPYKYERYQP